MIDYPNFAKMQKMSPKKKISTLDHYKTINIEVGVAKA
jgi:hypothetical protein